MEHGTLPAELDKLEGAQPLAGTACGANAQGRGRPDCVTIGACSDGGRGSVKFR